MEAMPHLVQMHQKYADKGLVVLTVSIDTPDDKEMVKDANAFLHTTKAPFRNFLLNEPDWSKKVDFTRPPCYYIFDRRGKWERFRAEDAKKGVNYDEMD